MTVLDVLTPQVIAQGGLATALGIAMLWNASLRREVKRLHERVAAIDKKLDIERSSRLEDRGRYADVLTLVAEKNGALAHALERLTPGG